MKNSKSKVKQTKTYSANHAGNVILHLSDLHFGYDRDTQAKAQRNTALQQLKSVINDQESGWKPTIICITGDIAMTASLPDYSCANKWLSDLLRTLNLTPDSLVICPGNHDVRRNIAEGYAPPRNNIEADRFLRVDHFRKQVPPFKEFNNFCAQLSIPPYLVGRKKSYLTGVRLFNNIRFICLNSAWFSQRNIVNSKQDDANLLWLGLPILEYLESKKTFLNLEHNPITPFTIALFHHPFDVLHDNERNQRPPRKSTQEYIAYRSHLILTGHDHGIPTDPTPIMTRAYHFRGGATYENSRYENSFHLIRLEDNYLLERRFLYEPSSSKSLWSKIDDSSKLYYWDYSKRIIENQEKQKELSKIENNYKIFEGIMLQADYENGLKTLTEGCELLISVSSLLTPEEKTNIQTKYSDSVLNNLSIMTLEQGNKYKEIVLRILNI